MRSNSARPGVPPAKSLPPAKSPSVEQLGGNQLRGSVFDADQSVFVFRFVEIIRFVRPQGFLGPRIVSNIAVAGSSALL